jgi:hypothetical protein
MNEHHSYIEFLGVWPVVQLFGFFDLFRHISGPWLVRHYHYTNPIVSVFPIMRLRPLRNYQFIQGSWDTNCFELSLSLIILII